MELSNVNDQYISTDNRSLWEFTQNLMPGDINCINGSKEKNVMGLFYKLIKAFSKNRTPVGYLIAKKQYSRQNLYLRYDHVSQSKPLNSLKEIDHEIKRIVTHYENPIIFIKDFFKISIGSNYWQKSRNIEFEEVTKKLKEIAEKHKVSVYITMLYDSEDVLKQYYLLFDTKGNGLIRKKIKKYYFTKQFCLNSFKPSTYKSRKEIHHQLILTHPGLKPIEKSIIVTSIIGLATGHNELWFRFPFPQIYVGTTFVFDKRIIPEDFKGYNVVRTSCASSPKRYFTKDRSVPVEEKYSPENLRIFVENHLEYISWKLNRPKLTKEEALDALTGGFKWHIEECNRCKQETQH